MNNNRFGTNPEKKRIKRKPTNITLFESEQNVPLEVNTESFGLINYDPVYGWLPRNYMGSDAEGTVKSKYSTRIFKRSDGLPGARL